MKWLFVVLAVMILILIIRSRRRSIVGIKAQRKHFKKIAESLALQFQSDQYFVALVGKWNDLNVAILPHQFEGPGALTLVYMETRIPAVDRNWIEPNVSLGRALVESNYGYDVSGTCLPAEKILDAIKNVPYPYVAVTLPTRFIYSPLLQRTGWTNFVVLIVLNEGRKPSEHVIRTALRSAEGIANAL